MDGFLISGLGRVQPRGDRISAKPPGAKRRKTMRRVKSVNDEIDPQIVAEARARARATFDDSSNVGSMDAFGRVCPPTSYKYYESCVVNNAIAAARIGRRNAAEINRITSAPEYAGFHLLSSDQYGAVEYFCNLLQDPDGPGMDPELFREWLPRFRTMCRGW
jgi:hypothetical protein